MKKLITQTELAETLGMSQGQLNNILNGRRNVSPEKSFQLEKQFGISIRIWLSRDTKKIKQALEQEFGTINFS